MSRLVCQQSVILCKTFSAVFTLIQLHPSVCSLVSHHMIWSRKAPPTSFTYVRLLSSMYSLVSRNVWRCYEPFLTKTTGMEFRFRWWFCLDYYYGFLCKKTEKIEFSIKIHMHIQCIMRMVHGTYYEVIVYSLKKIVFLSLSLKIVIVLVNSIDPDKKLQKFLILKWHV